MPPPSIALFFEMFAGHGGSMLATQRTICPTSGRFDHRFDAPLSPTHLVDPIRVVARIGVESLWQATQGHIKAFAQKILGLTLVVGRSPGGHEANGEQASANHGRGELHPAPAFAARATDKVGAGRAGFHSRGVNGHRHGLAAFVRSTQPGFGGPDASW